MLLNQAKGFDKYPPLIFYCEMRKHNMLCGALWYTPTNTLCRAHEFTPGLMVGSVLFIFIGFFCVVLLCAFAFLVTISVRLYLQLFAGRFMSYLCYVCLFV